MVIVAIKDLPTLHSAISNQHNFSNFLILLSFVVDHKPLKDTGFHLQIALNSGSQP